MNGLERTLRFIRNEPVDRPPFHPIIMRWAAQYAAVPYKSFCLDPREKCHAMIACADDFDLDWVTVMSDPYAEASAFGIEVEYPENDLPKDTGGHLASQEAVPGLQPYRVEDHARLVGRVKEIETFKEQVGDRLFIVGWVEGPVAEYADIRGLTPAAMDMMDDPDIVAAAFDVIVESALPFITAQVNAGAHCIGIGDAFCSQIGPGLYRSLAFEREKRMVDHIHALGALAKLHICGNTSALLPDMIRTGADIIDIDHLVPTMADAARLLAPGQVFCGKSDPVADIQDGTPEQITAVSCESHSQALGRCIVSAGCEITPGTSNANMRHFRAMADRVIR
ncbi:Uroporphyrinogen decarboxylase [Pontiella desulfatans]|uniref:Uroporphyrinogen decarboxylase n=1 Tax=Pontiella desulfatans TaxID=2750659 RepID=A0A6C2TXD9_PONDE|nr:uroporphyrinogen decarboxylase family protein [Pontiella desulfatans]VGO12358.1 Uroporphyrinogen decarboxylase [Pontiella desulfatans]